MNASTQEDINRLVKQILSEAGIESRPFPRYFGFCGVLVDRGPEAGETLRVWLKPMAALRERLTGAPR